MDSRGPNDFSGNTAAADIDEGDEDDVDEDPEDLLLSSSMRGGGSKRRGDGKLKSGIPMSATERLGGSVSIPPLLYIIPGYTFPPLDGLPAP
jgi:hypothetical protein